MEIGLYHILAIQVVAVAMIYYRVTSMDMASVTPSMFLPSWIASVSSPAGYNIDLISQHRVS